MWFNWKRWLRRAKSGANRKTQPIRRTPAVRFQPWLEGLEDRLAPAVFTVNTSSDTVDVNPGDGLAVDVAGFTSLRAAIMEANATAGADTINIPAGTYSLTISGTGENAAATGDLDITGDLTITGAGAATTIIDAGGIDRVVDVIGVNPATISGVTIRNGNAGDDFSGGGGVHLTSVGKTAAYTMTFTDCVISGNIAVNGGGINNDDTENNSLVLTRTTVSNNSATTDGGGIVHGPNGTGSLTLTDSIVRDNKAARENGGILAAAALPSDLTITGSTISGNSAADGVGGGVTWFGNSFVMTKSTVSGNTAKTDGGGIIVAGGSKSSVTLTNSTISGNTAGRNGGGLYNDGPLSISGDSFASNVAHGSGGGIFSNSGSVTISVSNLTGNAADQDGGGIFTKSGVTVSRTDLFQNTSGILSKGSGGGIYAGGVLNVSDSRFFRNSALSSGDGGGIYLDFALGTISSTTFDSNSASNGGGINAHKGTLQATNTTLVRNFANEGGGIYTEAPTTVNGVAGTELFNCTLTSNGALNFGGGIRNVGLGLLTLRNTLIAGNRFENITPISDLSGRITTDLGHNLIGNPTGATFPFPPVLTDLLDVDPLLAPLGDPSIPATTVALLPGSPAIDAGDNTKAPPTDQRGRDRIVNGTIDIGAFESSGFTITITDGDNQETPITGAFPIPLSVRVVSNAADEPAVGGIVTFGAPDSGPSVTFPSGNTATLNGSAPLLFVGSGSVSATANELVGSYTVSASARGAASVNFNLRNRGPNIFTVTNTDDSGLGSLRQAMLDANATTNVLAAVPDEIHFDIDGTNIHTITPLSQLPFITDAVVINGYTQPGASPNTHAMTDPDPSDNAVLKIELDGSTLLTNGIGLVLGELADGSTIRGLDIDGGFSRGIVIQASDIHIEGCFIGVDPTGIKAQGNGFGIFFDFGTETSNGVVGGTTPDKRNVISGNDGADMFLQSGNNHLIQGNLIGTDATGLVRLSGGNGISIQGSNDNTIGGSTLAERNVINANSAGINAGGSAGNKIQGNFIQVLIDGVTPGTSTGIGIALDTESGTQIGGLTATPGTGPGNVIGGNVGIECGVGTLIEGNLIGTDATGTKALGTAIDGIQINGVGSDTIGGSSPSARNVISGFGRAGIFMLSGGAAVHDILIQNNFIGTDITGTPNSMGNGEGIELANATKIQIEDNVVAGNNDRGVELGLSTTNIGILGNSIFANGALGIDLVGGDEQTFGFGVTANDPGDGDGSPFDPNNLQNFPEITSVTSTGVSTTFTGKLNSTPNTAFRIEFFANDAADPSGFGEGQIFLGAVTPDNLGPEDSFGPTDANGDTTFTVTLPVGVGASQVVTATATDPNGNTSEFSAVHTVEVIVNADLAVTQTDSPDPATVGDDVTYQITVVNDGPGAATGVTLIDMLPSSINPAAVSSDHFFVQQGFQLTFDLGSLDAGASTTINVTVHPTAAGGLSNFVRVQCNEVETNGANNTDTENTTVNPATATHFLVSAPSATAPNTAFSITVTALDQFENKATGYRGTVHFSSSDTNIAGSVKLPANFTFSAADAGVHTFTNGVTLQTIGTQTITATDTIDSTFVGSAAVLVAPNGTTGFVVTNTLDFGPGSLRQAILDANAHSSPDLILFKIGTGAHTIFVGDSGFGALPTITDRVQIDATTQPGFATVRKPIIEVSGTKLGAGDFCGLQIAAARSFVEGLVINDFAGSGIRLSSDSIQITDNFIGTDLSGTHAKGNGVAGVEILANAGGIIGMNQTFSRGNVISGNIGRGILIHPAAVPEAIVIAGNFVGTDYTGTRALPNSIGIEVSSPFAEIGGAPSFIGAESRTVRNVISGNINEGVLLLAKASVKSNFIGTDVLGTHALGNGVGIAVHAADATIGGIGADGTARAARNIISGNLNAGIEIDADSTNVVGNFIGTDVLGTHAVANLGGGIVVNAGSNNRIGGLFPTGRNVISGNLSDGIRFFGDTSTGNSVQGNFIGSDVSGTHSLGGQQNGVVIFGGSNNLIGGTKHNTAPGHFEAANVVSGNLANGVLIQGSRATNNLVQGNLIGVSASGKTRLANNNGVAIDQSATGNTIGGTTAGARNTISGNTIDGVFLHGDSANLIQGNFIGANQNGTAPLPNAVGVHVATNGATVGGTITGATNVISGNLVGVLIDSGSTGNAIQGNLVGLNSVGKAALSNGVGVKINTGSDNTIGGTIAGAGNVISGNTDSGIVVTDGEGNLVQGNLIGADTTGKVAIGNGQGILIDTAFNNTIGGTTPAERNVISGNKQDGIVLNAGATGNQIIGNFIGTDVTGVVALANRNGLNISGPNNLIGGRTTTPGTGPGNVISGNSHDGVFISSASGNQVLGNLVGANVSGTKALRNGAVVGGKAVGSGVDIDHGSENIIGGLDAGSLNVISGNANDGVLIQSGSDNQVLGNFIGTDVSGKLAVANGSVQVGSGVEVIDSRSNLIGTDDPLGRNVISGNIANGIRLTGTRATNNFVQGNFIGTNVSGTTAMSNGAAGVLIDNKAQNNSIGEMTPGGGNLISGNVQGAGVAIRDAATSENLVLGNLIGTDVLGGISLANSIGIAVFGATDNIVAGNVISGNLDDGINIQGVSGSAATGNLVQGNFIGTDLSGTQALANGAHGVFLTSGASSNMIGGTDLGAGNVISGNRQSGIQLSAGASGNSVQGNFIGTDFSGTFVLPNRGNGILVASATATVIGGSTPGAANVISANAGDGINISASGTQVQGNLVGTDVTGFFALPNAGNGVKISGIATGNVVGGTSSDAANVISGNANDGVLITGTGAKNNQVMGNFIGTDPSGIFAVRNQFNGVEISSGANTNTIGSADEGSGNVIAFNGRAGVLVNSGVKNRISGNSIFTNVGLGISLNLANSANSKQAAPQLISADLFVIGTAVSIDGKLTSKPSTTFTLEFFGSSATDAEGQRFLGAATVTTNAQGVVFFTVQLPVEVSADELITATATDPLGNTSRFSNAITVT